MTIPNAVFIQWYPYYLKMNYKLCNFHVNPFHATDLFWYIVKTWCFQGVSKGTSGMKWINFWVLITLCINMEIISRPKNYSHSTYATFSEKLTFLASWYAYVGMLRYQGVRSISFSETFAYLLNDSQNNFQWFNEKSTLNFS